MISSVRPTASAPRRARHTRRLLSWVSTSAAALTLLAACADAPSAPAATAPAPRETPSALLGEVLATPQYVKGLKRTTPVAADIVTSFRVGIGGGRFTVPGGLTVQVPSGVFLLPTTLKVTTLAGQMVAYDFQPHGLVFLRPLAMQQDLRGTEWNATTTPTLEVGYFLGLGSLLNTLTLGLVSEILPAQTDAVSGQLSFNVNHFSGYMVSMGRQSSLDGDEGY